MEFSHKLSEALEGIDGTELLKKFILEAAKNSFHLQGWEIEFENITGDVDSMAGVDGAQSVYIVSGAPERVYLCDAYLEGDKIVIWYEFPCYTVDMKDPEAFGALGDVLTRALRWRRRNA